MGGRCHPFSFPWRAVRNGLLCPGTRPGAGRPPARAAGITSTGAREHPGRTRCVERYDVVAAEVCGVSLRPPPSVPVPSAFEWFTSGRERRTKPRGRHRGRRPLSSPAQRKA
ncbi:hypothetical protein ACE1SV_74500 [Streptomyces sennicomposti]